MDEETAIINSNTRNEKIKNFFVNNKKTLITKFFIFSFRALLLIIVVSSSIIKSYSLEHTGVFHHSYNILIHS